MLSEEARGSSNGTGLARDSLVGRISNTVINVYTGSFSVLYSIHDAYRLDYTVDF